MVRKVKLLKPILILFAGIVLFLFFCNAYVVSYLSCGSPPQIPYQAILYFSFDSSYSKQLEDVSQYRLDQVIERYHAQPEVRAIIVNGHKESPGSAQRAKDYLVSHGIPEDKIYNENLSSNTWENISFAIPILDQLEVNAVMVVSSPYHISRIVKYFERQNAKTILTWSSYKDSLDNRNLKKKFAQIFHELLSIPRDFLLYDQPIRSTRCF